MALKNYQYNTIMRTYDARQSATRALLDERQSEIEAKLPEYATLQARIIENSLQYARMSLFSGPETDHSAALASLREKNDTLSKQKEELLVKNGYPADYLTSSYPDNYKSQ